MFHTNNNLNVVINIKRFYIYCLLLTESRCVPGLYKCENLSVHHNEISDCLLIGRKCAGPSHVSAFFGFRVKWLWCKSRLYCGHISPHLVKTTLRILGQQIRDTQQNMSSYYVDGVRSKCTATAALFPNRAGPGAEDCGSVNTAAIAFAGLYGVAHGAYLGPVLSPGFGHSHDSYYQSFYAHEADNQHRVYPWMTASGTYS